MRVEIAHFGRVRRASSTSPWRGLRRVISAANTELSPPFRTPAAASLFARPGGRRASKRALFYLIPLVERHVGDLCPHV